MKISSRVLVTLVAIWSAFGSYFFDWNATHIHNPHWPPHAKFHNAQTMLLGTCIGLLSITIVWLLAAVIGSGLAWRSPWLRSIGSRRPAHCCSQARR